MSEGQDRIQITLTPGQAYANISAADLFTRLSIGQLEEITALVRQGVIPMCSDAGTERRIATHETCDLIEHMVRAIKSALGYHSNGSHGIGHPHVCLEGRQNYEIKKVVEKVLAEWREPSPKFRGVSYDGLDPRYTSDPAPEAVMLQKQSTKPDNAQLMVHKPAKGSRKTGVKAG